MFMIHPADCRLQVYVVIIDMRLCLFFARKQRHGYSAYNSLHNVNQIASAQREAVAPVFFVQKKRRLFDRWSDDDSPRHPPVYVDETLLWMKFRCPSFNCCISIDTLSITGWGGDPIMTSTKESVFRLTPPHVDVHIPSTWNRLYIAV